MKNKIQYQLNLPTHKNHLLLHSCCAPCSGEIIQRLIDSKIKFSIFFYNPNIHPLEEYEIRKKENKKFADKNNISFIDADYDTDNWFEQTKGMEWEPERGKRCTACFEMRFFKTAQYAHQHHFDIFSSTLGISRWKNMEQINQAGEWAAEKMPNLEYWTINWRKNNGSQRMLTISKDENFYKQEYCGCVYSLRDTNIWRQKNSREKVTIGKKFYTNSIKKSTQN
ncbi:MAG: hypothetical protein CMD49_01540 [Gammaproteobacteria bacterium]|nr:hypothetical protein [Gammaproteobacteria bacterium]